MTGFKQKNWAVATALLCWAIAAPLVVAAAPVALDARIVMSGHSLTDPIEVPLRHMLQEMGVRHPVLDRSTIPGSPMQIRWREHAQADPVDARAAIADYDVLVLTERVGLSNTVPYHDSPGYALQWASHAWKEGNSGKGAATVLYASWVQIISGPGWENPYKDPDGALTFRERMPIEMAGWEDIAASVNAQLDPAAPRMRIIPGPLVMQAAYDAIGAGEMPGITDMSQLFADDIHVNDLGAYMIALAHYAVIYDRDPRELPDRIGPHGEQELAAFMQELVWNVVAAYPQPADVES